MATRDLTHIALFAAVTAALGLLPPLMLPLLGVPITAQSMGPMLAGAVLGARRGGLAMALFILLVALGFPSCPAAAADSASYWAQEGDFCWLIRRQGMSLDGCAPAPHGRYGFSRRWAAS